MEANRQPATPTPRLTWLAALAGSLLLTVVLLGARAEGAVAAPAPPSSTPVPSLEEELAEEREEEELEALEEALRAEEEDEEFLGEDFLAEELGGTDCELAHEALEEGLLTPTDVEDLCTAEEEWLAEVEGRSSRASSSRARRKARSQCSLRSTKAHVAARRKRLRLMIGYTTSAPTKVRIEIHVGKHRLGVVKRHVGRSGVLRIARRVGKRWSGKVRVRVKDPSCSALRSGSTRTR
jgi:hypothetical protein